MERRTEAHLGTADRNQAIARALSDSAMLPHIRPLPLEWAAVANFYAAVHFVNAYLYERQGYEPKDHTARQRAVDQTQPLRRVAASYWRLSDHAYWARYRPGYGITPAQVRAD